MQNRTFDQLGSECVQDNDRRCGFVYLLSSVSPISAFSWEVFSDGLAWGMGRKRIVWLRHARMLVCGEVFPAVLCRAVAFAARFPVFATRRWMRCFPMVRGVSVRGRVAWIGRFV